MASQNESDKKSGIDEVKTDTERDGSKDSGSVELESKEVEFEPFSDDDPYGAARISSLFSETSQFLDSIQAKPVGFETATQQQLRSFQEDAVQRAKWSQARQDVFIGFLRLGRPIPPRSKRIL